MKWRSEMASVGQQWFIRNQGASALQMVELLEYHGEKVWGMREIGGVLPGPLSYRERGVDFDFVQEVRKDCR